MAEVRQVDGVEVRALQKRVQAVLGAQVSFLLREKKTRERDYRRPRVSTTKLICRDQAPLFTFS